MSVEESFYSPSPRLLVCARCWTSFFSTPSFRSFSQIQGQRSRFEYTASVAEVHESATRGCNWCRFILSFREGPEGLALNEADSLPLDMRIGFGADSDAESFTPRGNNRFRLWINGAAYHLTAFTTSDNLVSEFVTARELENDVDSEKAFQQVRKWLEECDGHKACPRKRRYKLPTRVVEVSPEGTPETPRLLATQGLVDHYAALSYCWGTNQTGVTSSSNLTPRLRELDMHSLSRTIQDAIATTRHIGVKYLWVDALCIIQDSEQDKLTELSSMCKIYQQALVTIVAANAADANQGFLADRAPPEPSMKVPFWTPDGRLGTVSLRPEGWYGGDSEPVNARAWTLQERLLSPRLLIYATHTLQYQCQQETVNLGGSMHIPSGLGSWRLPSCLVDPCFGNLTTELTVQSATQIWRSIISQYSLRRLSYIEDKLTALAGIAETFHSQIRGQYLAGLWAGEPLPGLLLWQAVGYPTPSPIYTAPSWSWAALDSPVAFRG